jgi:hypothetical protein
MNRIDRLPAVAAALLVTLAGTGQVLALTKEQAIENCRNTVGRPIVQACMGGRRDSGNIEQCRAQASPKVKACVIDALSKAHGTGSRSSCADGFRGAAAHHRRYRGHPR